MKIFALAFAALILGVSAEPSQSFLEEFKTSLVQESYNGVAQQNLVSSVLIRTIEHIAKRIRDFGLDPFEINSFNIDYSSPLTDNLKLAIIIDNLSITGFSNVVINNLNYSPLRNRLTFDIVLPEIALNTDRTLFDVSRFNREFSSDVSGSLKITNIVIKGEIRFRVGVITGVSIRDITLENNLGGIESDLRVIRSGEDVSDQVNQSLGEDIPNFIQENNRLFNRILEFILKQLF